MTNNDENKIKLEKRASYGVKFSVIDEIGKMVTESDQRPPSQVK